jgi:hypothetical protein
MGYVGKSVYFFIIYLLKTQKYKTYWVCDVIAAAQGVTMWSLVFWNVAR